MRQSKAGFFVCLIFLVLACEKPAPTPTPPVPVVESTYENVQDRGLLENAQLDEASGLAASRLNRGYLWSHNDSGDKNRIFLFDTYGKGKYEFTIQGAENRDWEDMAVVKEADGSATIYVADFGDNNSSYNSYAIYWFKEPVITASTPALNTITQVNKVSFTVSDGSRDMECILVDQQSKDLFIISKRETQKQLYKIASANMVAGSTTKAEFIQKLDNISQPFSSAAQVIQGFYITAGSVSPDNTEILVKNYLEIYYWKRKEGETIPQALARQAKTVPYQMEPQGEGITFAEDGGGYYTISESADGSSPVHLFFYKKK